MRWYDGRVAVLDLVTCELCYVPLFLNPSESPGLCRDCFAKLSERDELEQPCRRCGRRHTFQFSCGWCGCPVCDGCVYAEHDDDNCVSPWP